MSRIRFGSQSRTGIVLMAAVTCAALLQWPTSACGQETQETEKTLTVDQGEVTERSGSSVTIQWTSPAAADVELKVTAFYGSEDKGTEQGEWQHHADLAKTDKKGATYQVVLQGLEPETAYAYRIRTTGSAGDTWSETANFTTMPWSLPGYALLLIVIVVLTAPFYVGGRLAKRFRMPDHGWKIGLVVATLASGLLVIGFRWPPKLGIDLSGGTILIYEVDQEKKDPEKPVNMDNLVAAVTERVNPGGQKEMTIRPYGGDQIEIIIPRIDPEEARRVEKIVSRAGTLEFRILANRVDNKDLLKRARIENTKILRDSEGQIQAWWVPVQKGREADFESYLYSTDREGRRTLIPQAQREVAIRETVRRGEKTLEVLVAKDSFDVDGHYLTDAARDWDDTGNPRVSFRFDSAGAQLFGRLTTLNQPDEVQNFYRKLGIVLDGKLYSAPRIKSPIYDRGVIEGSFTEQEVDDLVRVLNAGSLPTALNEQPIFRLVTGPTLGLDTVIKSSWAIGISVVLVLLFMLVYYRFSGVVACAALLTNLVLILAIMMTVGAAFTLPGMAGLVLTVGMAVDANVLIFERIREELNRGAALRMAIRNGFGRATTTIVDANVTTLITGVILFVVGTDVIKGFAITLILGVLLSMYTAIFCSRVVFDLAERRRWITALKMMRIVGATQFDFLGKRRVALTISALITVVGLVGVGLRSTGKGVRLLDIDFTGGVSVVTVFNQPQKIGDVRKALKKLPDLAVSDVQLENEPPGKTFRVNTSQSPEMDENDVVTRTAIDLVEEELEKAFGKKLATNLITIEQFQAIEKPEASQPPTEKPTGPGKADQTRHDLPDDSVLAMAGLSPGALAQAAPAEPEGDGQTPQPGPQQPPEEIPPEITDPGETGGAAEPPAGQPKQPAGQPKPPAEEPTQPTAEPRVPAEPATDAFAGGAKARLTFSRAVSYDTVMEMLAGEFGSSDKIPPHELTPLLESTDPDTPPKPDLDFAPGDNAPYKMWSLMIKLPPQEAQTRLASIQQVVADTPFFPSSNTIGGKVAAKTQLQAIYALVASLLFIMVYIRVRFQRLIFGLAAVVALVHDVLITLGAIALSAFLAPYFGFLLIDQFKIGLPVLAAFLTIIGYSLNDTIVVFDRIREVRGKAPQLTEQMVNNSINQTLSRTLLTSLTTLIVVLILYMFGGERIHAFAFALVIGVFVGTYSSVFVASPVLLWMIRPSGNK